MLQLDELRADEALVRIVAVGVCHTDIAFKAARVLRLPAVFGHEGAGIVERVGADVANIAVGDRVVLTFRSCGACGRCAAGDPAYCAKMNRLNVAGARPDGSNTLTDGGSPIGGSFFGQSSFASHALAYERNMVKVPDDIPLGIMGPLGCGVQTGAGGIMRSLACRPGSTLLVTGCGPVGLSAVMGGKIQGCSRIVVVEPHAARRALALEFGATDAIDPAPSTGEDADGGVDIGAAVRSLLPDGIEYAFDTTGVPAVMNGALRALGSKGVLGIVGLTPANTPLPGDVNTVMAMGQSIRGIIEGDSDPQVFIPELIEHHRRGDLPFDRMITKFPFARINEAIAAQHRGDCIKVVLIMDANSEGPRA